MKTRPGLSYPLGATVTRRGVNFSVFSKNCDYVELLLFDAKGEQVTHSFKLDRIINRTFYYWHIFIEDLGAGAVYAYRVHGPHIPEQGFLFDANKVLLDPYAKAIIGDDSYSREAACKHGDNITTALKGVVVDLSAYHWQGDTTLKKPMSHTIIYEMHVKGFTAHESSALPADARGTYRGVIEKIPYLQSLGITAVELMPVQQFDAQFALPPRTNYWGYGPLSFFAPHRAYSSRRDPLGVLDEFRDMVKALHRAGIEVILDVVFNHTAEGGVDGPTVSFKGFENKAYYILDELTSQHLDFSGCGNTLNANQSITRRLIIDALHFWVQDMHIDGFRFDLASVFSRDEWGKPLKSSPILWEIESDPVLAGTKIIAEPWDAVGLYEGGSFTGHRWAEWNDRFRDDCRRFVRGDEGFAERIANRVCGSPKAKVQKEHNANRSINFVACHDGFTLADLVAYERRHNEANGHNNLDGAAENFSANYGTEGETDTQSIRALRLQQIRNFLVLLFTAHGTPMLQMGDECLRSLKGNNNAYCQDNNLSYLNWNLSAEGQALIEFVRKLIAFNKSNQLLQLQKYWHLPPENIAFHGVHRDRPDFRPISHTLAFSLFENKAQPLYYVILNSYGQDLTFELPLLSGGAEWKRLIDTALTAPADFSVVAEPISERLSYTAVARSYVVLKAE